MIKKFNSPACESCQVRVESVFCKLTDDELNSLSIQKHCNYYQKGQTIFSEGNKPFGLFCINKGKVKISQSGFEGKEQIIRLAKDGDILGYRALISGEGYSATATVIEDSKVCLIPKEVFFDLLQSNSEITKSVMKLLANELKDAESKITNLAQKPVIERLAEVILMLKEYYGYEDGESMLNITITREEIANIVGTATETTIRLLSELRKEGVIDLSGKKIKILNNNTLIKLANLYD
ncbi:MAG: Crp/Fnr family transcriptional regulator [Ignavibacteria bacterium]|nr:Crp/Fnr family transcriptional regulator [Ignavibacteria bacterium]